MVLKKKLIVCFMHALHMLINLYFFDKNIIIYNFCRNEFKTAASYAHPVSEYGSRLRKRNCSDYARAFMVVYICNGDIFGDSRLPAVTVHRVSYTKLGCKILLALHTYIHNKTWKFYQINTKYTLWSYVHTMYVPNGHKIFLNIFHSKDL
jgi:hypothetical protein